jgi:hypothetical protein
MAATRLVDRQRIAPLPWHIQNPIGNPIREWQQNKTPPSNGLLGIVDAGINGLKNINVAVAVMPPKSRYPAAKAGRNLYAQSARF